jgi:DNA-binding SARP family transcriptional activator
MSIDCLFTNNVATAHHRLVGGLGMLEVRLLGQFDVRLDGRHIDLPTRPAQALLAYLALHVGTRTRREQLAGLLWPDADEASARNNLRQALWRLRAALGAASLQADKITIAFEPSVDDRLDVLALTGNDPSASSTADLIDAVSAYTGELLPGFYDDWVALERERLRAVFERKIELLLDRLIEQRRWRDTVEWAERWIALGEIPEAAYRALMVAQSQLYGPASVTTIYRRCVEALRHEFDLEPSEPTQLLYRQLARGQDVPISAAAPADQRASAPSGPRDERPWRSRPSQPSDRMIGSSIAERDRAPADQIEFVAAPQATPGAYESRPSGTVAFLFTDIEGSTQLWGRYPVLMPEAFGR